MNIAILAAGAGQMICGSCLRDSATASALKRLGHEVTLIPLYTPIRTDGEDISGPDVFYGGVNVYLQNASPIFRHTPRAIDWLLDRPGFLKAAGDWGAQTTPDSVAGLTAAILAGEEGTTRKELHRLIEFLKDQIHPQVISLPNLMFIGLAKPIRDALKVPVLCELTGEDIFLDAMSEPHRSRMWDLIRQRIGHVDQFISTTSYYADRMSGQLGIPRDRMAVIPTGLSPEFFIPLRGTRDDGRTVGYMARICPEKGLDRLVDAMLLLQGMPGFGDVKLLAAGYLGARDRKWYDSLKARIDASPLKDGFTYLGEVDREQKIRMLDSLDVFSVPTAYEEAKGIYVLEAMSRGVPVVQPNHGSFPELIEQTGGGILVPPNDPRALAEKLGALLKDPQRRSALGHAGRRAVEESLTEQKMANRMLDLFGTLR